MEEHLLIRCQPLQVDFNRSKKLFNQLSQMVRSGKSYIKHPIDSDTIDWQNGYKFTLSRNDKGQDFVYYHNHSINDRF